MSHSADDIRKHVKVYIGVFVALLILTLVTVAASYLDLPIGPSVIVALTVAGVKGSLVAMFFMHLKGEKPWVMWSLALTAVFVLFVFALPMWTEGDHIVGTRPNAWSAGTELPHAPEHSPAPAH
jgi:cytochrome c oxidase subunit 4